MNLKLLNIVFLGIVILDSCQKDDEFSDQFDFMYGNWRVVAIHTLSLPPEASLDILNLSYPNNYSISVRNLSVDVGKFDIGVVSIDKLTLVFKSKSRVDGYSPPPGFHNTELKTIIHRTDSISLYNLVTDYGYFEATLEKE